jgi:hypothetical protein
MIMCDTLPHGVIGMDDVVLIFPAHQNVLSGDHRLAPMLKFNLGMMIFSSIIVILSSLLALPAFYEDRVAWNAFVADSHIAQASFDGCYTSIILKNKVATFSYAPDPQTEITGTTVYWGSCNRYPAGTPVMIRYNLADPENAVMLHHIDVDDFLDRYMFYVGIGTIALSIFNLVVYTRQFLNVRRLERTGQVRRGRIIRLKQRWWLLWRMMQLDFEVINEDGARVNGKQIVAHKIAKHLTEGSLVAVLYAHPKNYFVL